MTIDSLRQEIAGFLGFTIAGAPVDFVSSTEEAESAYCRYRISYPSTEGESIPAYLLVPDGVTRPPAISIGPVTTQAAIGAGFDVVAEARDPGVGSLVVSVLEQVLERGATRR